MPAPTILHVDLDAFYASVEQLLDPSLRGRPVLVGGGVVLAASYEARVFGIAAPMGVRQALARCPQAVVVPGSFDRYLDLSRRVFEICRRYTPLIEQISIDEAFLEVRGVARIHGDAVSIGQRLRSDIRREVGLPASVGVARTKFLAKVASRQAKPDGLLVVRPETELEFLHGLAVEAIWGVGPKTALRLRERGIVTVGDLAGCPPAALRRWIGPGLGAHIHALAWNRDPRLVSTVRRAGSVGSQSALGRGTSDPVALGRVLLGLSDRVASRLRAKDRVGRTITVRVRFPDMTGATRATTLPQAVCSTSALHRAALPLLEAAREDRPTEPLTLVGISVSKLEVSAPLQLELPLEPGHPTRPGSALGLAHRLVDRQVDLARERFGRTAVGRTSVLLDPGARGVPEEFRTLAQRD